jgi:hypothetical protein
MPTNYQNPDDISMVNYLCLTPIPTLSEVLGYLKSRLG